MNYRASYRVILVFVLSLASGCGRRAAAIHDAAWAGDVEKVRALLAADATLLDDGTDVYGTPLIIAAGNGRLEVARLLLEKGAAVDLKNQMQESALWNAAFYGHPVIAELLLEKGAAVDAQDRYGITPLMCAAGNGSLEVVRLLLGKGAVVNAKQENGITPLFRAAHGGHDEVAKLLLGKGAVVDAKRNDGYTPLMQAAERGHHKVVQVLLENGASPNVEAQGMTPLRLAEKNGHTEVAELLRKAEYQEGLEKLRPRAETANPVNPERRDANEAKSVGPSGRSDREILEKVAPSIMLTGMMVINGKPLLLVDSGRKLGVGDHVKIAFEGVDYVVVITAIDRASFRLSLNSEEITRPIKPRRRP